MLLFGKIIDCEKCLNKLKMAMKWCLLCSLFVLGSNFQFARADFDDLPTKDQNYRDLSDIDKIKHVFNGTFNGSFDHDEFFDSIKMLYSGIIALFVFLFVSICLLSCICPEQFWMCLFGIGFLIFEFIKFLIRLVQGKGCKESCRGDQDEQNNQQNATTQADIGIPLPELAISIQPQERPQDYPPPYPDTASAASTASALPVLPLNKQANNPDTTTENLPTPAT